MYNTVDPARLSVLVLFLSVYLRLSSLTKISLRRKNLYFHRRENMFNPILVYIVFVFAMAFIMSCLFCYLPLNRLIYPLSVCYQHRTFVLYSILISICLNVLLSLVVFLLFLFFISLIVHQLEVHFRSVL